MRAYADEVDAAGAIDLLGRGYYNTACRLLAGDKENKHEVVMTVREGIELCLLAWHVWMRCGTDETGTTSAAMLQGNKLRQLIWRLQRGEVVGGQEMDFVLEMMDGLNTSALA